jgi:hypothetical protein
MTRYVYVAGRLSGDPPTYLANLAEMCAASRKLMDMGLTPINPGADALEGLMSGEVMDKARYQERSMDLLRLLAERDDAVLLVVNALHRDGAPSGGTAREIQEARRLGVPVFYHVEDIP